MFWLRSVQIVGRIATILVIGIALIPLSTQARQVDPADCADTGTTGVPEVECNILVQIYNGMNGPGWANSANWNTASAVNTWYGVSMSGGHVQSIKLFQNHLIGGLPADLTPLSGLQILLLYGNDQLTGNIPSLPASLLTVNLSNTEVAGSIPPLPSSLKYLDLRSTNITGSIPPLPATLETLFLGDNQLTGSIPPLPASLEHLFLEKNQLTGEIPSLPDSLVLFHAPFNRLTGSIPPLPPSLQRFTAQSNQLTGGIPPLPDSLQSFIVSNNKLTGTIPPPLPATLVELFINGNQLVSEIPPSIMGTAIAKSLYLCGGLNIIWTEDPAVEAWVEEHNPAWSQYCGRPNASPSGEASPSTNFVIPDPPPAPQCSDLNFDSLAIVRAWIPDEYRTTVFCHIIAVNGQYLWWYGSPLTNSGEVGVQSLLDLGVQQAVDVFSPPPVNMTWFEGGPVVCLRGSGYLWLLPASQAPRVPQDMPEYTVEEFAGYTCTTLWEPGTLVLTRYEPTPQ